MIDQDYFIAKAAADKIVQALDGVEYPDLANDMAREALEKRREQFAPQTCLCLSGTTPIFSSMLTRQRNMAADAHLAQVPFGKPAPSRQSFIQTKTPPWRCTPTAGFCGKAKRQTGTLSHSFDRRATCKVNVGKENRNNRGGPLPTKDPNVTV